MDMHPSRGGSAPVREGYQPVVRVLMLSGKEVRG
jgi:hypothetical protein